MGRSPKTEPAENQQQGHAAQPQPFQPRATNPPAPDAQSRPPAPVQARPSPPAGAAATGTPRAVTESEALARDLKEGTVSGFVGAGTTVAGDAEFRGMLRIDGHFTGRIRSEKGALIVSAGGVVDADVSVATARINGTVNGDVVAAERVELGRSARVRGNIQTPALVVEEGAVFEGQCRMRPKAAEAPARPEPQAVAAPRPSAARTGPAKANEAAG
ncbi:MAG TPA: polymer-forming cytoskeletal protein [Pyrinomonadaceae bacterium]|nr:polymer-forming cytoskeletal protein [Pyrinomonadaceae bacterium]